MEVLKLVLGVLLILMSVAGAISVLSGQVEEVAQRIIENGVDTTGVIDSRSVHYVGARWGKVAGGGRYYTMKYTFTTKDGRKYGGEINVSQEQAYAAKDGQKIRVRYHAKQPTINAPLGFKTYMTEKDVKELPKGMMLVTYFLMLLGGGWLTWSSWRRIWPAHERSARVERTIDIAPTVGARPQRVMGRAGKPAFGHR